MKKFIFVLPVLLTLPSYADIASGANNATCNSDTIGATEGSTDLEAQWSANQYSESAGQYLLFANNTVSQHQTCTAGNYCPGFTNQTFADATMGLNSCATNDANFPNSAAGASAATDCYRACNISNMGTGAGKTIAPIAHATAISGNDYYGAGVDTCVPTACDTGYHVETPTLASVIGTSEAGTGYTANDETGSEEYSVDMSNSVISGDASAFAVDYGNKGMIKGHGICSSRSATYPWVGGTHGDYVLQNDSTTATLPDSWGTYCYCQLDSYTLNGQSEISLSAPWVYNFVVDDGGSRSAMCARNCASQCASDLWYDDSRQLSFRAAILGTVELGSASCVANTISIDWDPKNGDAHTQNQCTYGGAVTIPEQPTKTGYTFGGWRIKPTTPAE